MSNLLLYSATYIKPSVTNFKYQKRQATKNIIYAHFPKVPSELLPVCETKAGGGPPNHSVPAPSPGVHLKYQPSKSSGQLTAPVALQRSWPGNWPVCQCSHIHIRCSMLTGLISEPFNLFCQTAHKSSLTHNPINHSSVSLLTHLTGQIQWPFR